MKYQRNPQTNLQIRIIKKKSLRGRKDFQCRYVYQYLIYNYKYKKWIIAYFASNRYDITLRMADDITGPWSEPYKLVDSKEYPQLYGSFFHPLSSYGDELYFLMSMWKPYNVFLMKTKLFKK